MTASTKSVSSALKRPLVRVIISVLAAAAVAATVLLFQSPSASAHCDSRTGPVVTAAQQALEKGDVNLILPYVKAEQEAELTAAFDQTMNLRKRGADVRELADEYFLETAVRLHRIGEGASYTGIKDHVENDPALEAAEASLQDGNPDEVLGVLDEALGTEVTERYEGVLAAREAEKANPSVETARERVEAELMFEKYILDISGAIHAAATHEGHEAGATEGAPAAETEHAH